MPISPRSVRDPATALANWQTGVQQAGNKWADGFAHPKRNPFDPSVINDDNWQAGVTAPEAKDKYRRNMASVNQDMVLQSVNGAGKSKYTSAATTKSAKMANFQRNFLPKLGQIRQNLDATMPRGPRGTNRARLNAFLDAVEQTRGTNT